MAKPSAIQFTAHFETVENGWVHAHLNELPGVITAAPSLDEAKEMLVDALREYLLSLGAAEGTASRSDTNDTAVEVIIRAA